VSAEIDERGNRTEHAYDAAGRKTATTDAQGNIHRFEYDADGNLTAEVDANSHRTEYTVNALDQRTTTRFHDGTTVQETQDALGRKTRMTDQAGVATLYAYDGLGRLTTVTQPGGLETVYTYDEAGNKLTQTDAEGRTTSWTYDALGREDSRTLPLSQSESLDYDAVGNLTQRTDFNGQVTGSIYDDNHRLSVRNFDDGSSETYTYDAVGNLLNVVQTAENSSTRTTSYTYDLRDRLKTHSQPNGAVITYDYDGAGNRSSVEVDSPTGATRTTTYAYDSLNRLATVTDANGLTSYGYDAVGNMNSVSHPNGTSQVYAYDDLNRLINLKTYGGTGALIEQYTYTLDPTGRRTAITELDGRSTTYGYDDLYRLTSETITDATNGNYSATYQYDDVGNRVYETVDGVQTQSSYDDNDRLTQQGGTTYTYDANGNTLTETLDGDAKTYIYDADDKLISSSTAGITTTYTYDPTGVRTSKTESGSITDYVIDTNRDYAQVLEEVTNNVSDVTYSYGHDLLSQERAGTASFYHYDGLGSTRLLSDELGAITDDYDYAAFGSVLNQSGATENSYLFTGEQFDSGLDQYYLRARYYNQSSGRFTQMDSWMGANSDPVTLHKYAYANVDPVSYLDPTGTTGLLSLGVRNNMLVALAASTIIYAGQPFFSALDYNFGDQDVNIMRRYRTEADVRIGVVAATMCAKELNEDCRASIPIIVFGSDVFEATMHMADAQFEGKGYVLSRGSGEASGWYRNLATECSGATGFFSGLDCDEYPFNSTHEGGLANYLSGGVSLRPIDSKANRSAGGSLGVFYDQCEVTPNHPQNMWFGVIAAPTGTSRKICVGD